MNNASAGFKTLPDLLCHVALRPDNLQMLVAGQQTMTWKEIYERSKWFASWLISKHVGSKDRVLILLPNSAEFFVAFYGVIISGAIAVPVFPGTGTERCLQLIRLCGGKQIILPGDVDEDRRLEFQMWASDNEIQLFFINEAGFAPQITEFPSVSPVDIAYIQYTSGSTGFPKGVPVTHHNLMVNIRQMVEALRITSADVFVSWLPVYHDMGLILNTMVPLCTGALLVLLTEGLHNPGTWLGAIAKYRGTVISAPDTAYRLCVKGIRSPQDYDLSSLRVALNASEPVHAGTYSLFEGAFSLKNVMVSGYGLAEATVAVAIHPPGEPPVRDGHGYVASGRPLKGVTIRIDNGGAGPGPDTPGEILVKSKALMPGYYNADPLSVPVDEDGFLRTGDIGYVDQQGNLFVLARKKNIIIQAGMTLYPDDVEQVVTGAGNIRQALAAGIELQAGEGERLFVFAEYAHSRPEAEETYHRLAVQIVNRIYSHFGLRPARIFLLKPKSLPRTANGKLQYSRLKEEFIRQSPRLTGRILYPVPGQKRGIQDS